MEYDEAATKLLLVLNEAWEEVCGKTIEHDDQIVLISPLTGNLISIAIPIGCFYPETEQIFRVRTIENLLQRKQFKQAFWQMFDLIVDELLPMNECTISFAESEGYSQTAKEQWRNQIIERTHNILRELNDQEQVLCTIPKYIKPNNPGPLGQTLLQLLR